MEANGRKLKVADLKEVYVVPGSFLSETKGLSQFTESVTVVNHTSAKILKKSRTGLVIPLSKDVSRARPRGVILIKVIWNFCEDDADQVISQVNFLGGNGNHIAACIQEAFKNHSPYNATGRYYSATMTAEIDLKELKMAGGAMYLSDFDILLTLGEGEPSKVQHPFSPAERVRKGIAADLPGIGDETFIMAIKAVDNSDRCRNQPDRYINLGDEVFHIPVEKDPSMLDGVHVTTRQPASKKNVEPGPLVDTIHMSFEDADAKFGLFTDIQSAKTRGDWRELYKRQLEDKQFAYKNNEFDRKEDLEQLGHRNTKEKDDMTRRRTESESQREEAKSFGEWFKIACGIVVTALTAVIAISKMAPPMKPA